MATLETLNLVAKHIGAEWNMFVIGKQVRITVGNNYIKSILAHCYDQLSMDEFLSLLQSFASAGLANGTIADNYTGLHEGLYRLILSDKLTITDLKNLLKDLAAGRVPSIQEPRQATVAVNPTRDQSIIEISTTPVAIAHQVSNAEPRASVVQTIQYVSYDPELYSLGKKYKQKLNLSEQESAWLNKFWNYGNVFNAIEGCELQIIKLFLLAMKVVDKRLKKEGSTLADEIEPLRKKDLAFQKNQPGYWAGYDGNSGSSMESDVYGFIYKKAEIVIREAWSHKRRLTADFFGRTPQIKEMFDKRLGLIIDEVITHLIPTIGIPDEATEMALNEATTTRWKVEFDKITAGFNVPDLQKTVATLYTLGHNNRKNPNLEHVYHEASKFIAPHNKLEALKFYLHYVWADLRSAQVDNKQLNKSIQKQLFANDAQLQGFQEIVDKLVANRSLKIALEAVEQVYKVKRKSITLDRDAIQRVEQQHNGTVSILDKYLNDDEPEDSYPLNVSVDEVMTAELILAATTSKYTMSPVQMEFVGLFPINNFELPASVADGFARERSLFKNQLIDSINDSCYDQLDDVLIEENADGYEINPNFYHQLF